MSLAKAAAAGAAVLTLVAGGYGVSTLFSGGMPDYDALATSTGKYVSDYKDYFVDATKNVSWWDWVYKNRYLVDKDGKDTDGEKRPEPKTAFTSIKNGSGDTADSIQKVCSNVYSAAQDKVKAGASGDGEFEEADVWRYCTAVKKKPKTIENNADEADLYKDGESADTYGVSKKANLISITSEDNAHFWKEQTRLFFRSEGERFGANFENDRTSIFGKFWHSKKGNIKDKCKEAYILKTADSTQSPPTATKEDIFKFCSLKGSE
ncbi:hypothetical protein MHSWG343_04870 [Candidatus Mycoplasma haematohominis]|uniref:Uncharacterized protein n=1 Tax=Candidatus Mycoplasma haematohominis TaxID=1494318 RepID=A0A478FTX7_9MOLU|nr:hypothetical protein MHSWG343_04870 [Candidatus Mycoplasma haemohominis]